MDNPIAVRSQLVANENSVDLMISRIFNADEVPFDLIETIRQYQQRLLNKGVSQSVDLKAATVNECKIYIGNISTPLDLYNISEQELQKQLQLPSTRPETNETTQTQTGKLNWHFAGINQFQSITIRVQNKAWQVEFSRLQRPYHSSLGVGDQKELKATAHREIYTSLCSALKLVPKNDMGNIVVLQGGPGLGKTHCAQHYFYHQEAKEHQIVAWLSGKSQDSFLQGWSSIAQQLRNIQSSQSKISDDEVIKEWCENQLGQWLLIIDEVNIDAAWLNARLPKRGGHVLITTHQPNYGIEIQPVQSEQLNSINQKLEQNSNSIQQTQSKSKYIIIPFAPLSNDDSIELLQAYAGNYWQATGYPKEQEAIEYLIAALGGYPSALTQMALLVHKKSISFARLVEQFKQPIVRNYLLSDTVFNQLKDKTFKLGVKKGWEQLLKYFNERYPKLTSDQHEQHLKQFIENLQQEMTQEKSKGDQNEKLEKIGNNENKTEKETEKKMNEKVVKSEILVKKQIDSSIIRRYWQEIEASCKDIKFNLEELTSWLHCLPIFYDKIHNQWQISQVGLTTLALQINPNSLPNIQLDPVTQETIEAKLPKTINTSNIPNEIDISFRLENANIKNAEIDILTMGKISKLITWQLPTKNPYFIPRPKLIDELKAKMPQKKARESSTRLVLTAATGIGGIGKTELARHYITNNELSDHYQNRFWLTATTEPQIRNEFMQLAIYLHLISTIQDIEDQELIKIVHDELNIHPGWLMVLDNADDFTKIENWIPKEGGTVLITTREPSPGRLNSEQIVSVPLLEPEEAIKWLCILSQRDESSLAIQERLSAKRLVEDLGWLPLAIAQAAAYLRIQSKMSIEVYRERFTNLLEDPTLASEESYGNTQNELDKKSRKVVASTWTLSLQAIEAYEKDHDKPSIAKNLLSFSAYLAPQNIPIVLMECCLKELPEAMYSNSKDQINLLLGYMVDEYIGLLLRYSLLERNGVKNEISIHVLVQQVMRNLSEHTKNSLKYNLILVDILKGELDKYKRNNLTGKFELLSSLLVHSENVIKFLSEISENNNKKLKILQQMAVGYSHAGKFLEAEKKFQLAIGLCNKIKPNDQLELSYVYQTMGTNYIRLMQYKKAEEQLEKALKFREYKKTEYEEHGYNHYYHTSISYASAIIYGVEDKFSNEKRKNAEKIVSEATEAYVKKFNELDRSLLKEDKKDYLPFQIAEGYIIKGTFCLQEFKYRTILPNERLLESAEEFLKKAEKYYKMDELRGHIDKIRLYNKFGELYFERKKYELSLKYYKKAEKLKDEPNLKNVDSHHLLETFQGLKKNHAKLSRKYDEKYGSLVEHLYLGDSKQAKSTILRSISASSFFKPVAVQASSSIGLSTVNIQNTLKA